LKPSNNKSGNKAIFEKDLKDRVYEEVLRIKKELEYEAQQFKNEESFKSHKKISQLEERVKTLSNENMLLKKQVQGSLEKSAGANGNGRRTSSKQGQNDWESTGLKRELLERSLGAGGTERCLRGPKRDPVEELQRRLKGCEAFHSKLFQLLDDLTPQDKRPPVWTLKDVWKWIRNMLDEYMRMKKEGTEKKKKNGILKNWKDDNQSKAEKAMEEIKGVLGAESLEETGFLVADLLVDVKQSNRIIDKIKQRLGLRSTGTISELEDFLDRNSSEFSANEPASLLSGKNKK
jgi:hypothetical protein